MSPEFSAARVRLLEKESLLLRRQLLLQVRCRMHWDGGAPQLQLHDVGQGSDK
jgi:hypothetical protein